jgi:hypothetical protein
VRVRLLFVGTGAGSVETPPPLAALPPGNCQVVGVVMVEETVSGTCDCEAALNGHVFAQRAGDVNTSAGIDVEPFIHGDVFTVT